MRRSFTGMGQDEHLATLRYPLHVFPGNRFETIIALRSMESACNCACVFLTRYGTTTIWARGALKFAPLIARVRGLEGWKVSWCNSIGVPEACWCFLVPLSRFPHEERVGERVAVFGPGSKTRPPPAELEPVCPLQAGRRSVALLPPRGLRGAAGPPAAPEQRHMETKRMGRLGKWNPGSRLGPGSFPFSRTSSHSIVYASYHVNIK